MCLNPKVCGEYIRCAKGHKLISMGTIHINRLARGDSLEFAVCQNCEDYSELGPPIPKHERGWLGR